MTGTVENEIKVLASGASVMNNVVLSSHVGQGFYPLTRRGDHFDIQPLVMTTRNTLVTVQFFHRTRITEIHHTPHFPPGISHDVGVGSVFRTRHPHVKQ